MKAFKLSTDNKLDGGTVVSRRLCHLFLTQCPLTAGRSPAPSFHLWPCPLRIRFLQIIWLTSLMLLYTIDGGIFKVKSIHCSEVVSQCLDAGLLQIGEPLRRSTSLKSYFNMKSCYWPAASHPDQLWNTPPVVLNLCQSFFQPVVVTFSNFFFILICIAAIKFKMG